MNDLKFAFRQLLKNPGFTAVVVLTLALGIGANTAIFTIADAVLFRPMDLVELDRMVSVSGALVGKPNSNWTLSPADYIRLEEEVSGFGTLAAYHMEKFNLTAGEDPEFVNGCRATVNFFEAFNIAPALGRAFRPEEEQPGKGSVVVLSHSLWRRAFAAETNLIGKVIELHGLKYDVIGVMPPQLNFPPGAELWVPFTLRPETRTQHGGFYLRTVGCLKSDVAIEQADAEAKSVAARLTTEWPDSHTGRTVRVDPLRNHFLGDLGPQMIQLMMGAVGFVLLIACVNVAILQLARMTSRGRELAIRSAVGASRTRLIRQVLIESVLLGLCGAAAGVWLALWGVEFIKHDVPQEVTQHFPNWQKLGINPLVLAYLTVLGVGTGILAGIMPAVLSSKVELSEALKDCARGLTASRSHHRLKTALVVAPTEALRYE